MIFLTFNDSPNGIFKSQVIGVCEVLSEIQSSPVKLVSFIPRQEFFKNRKKIMSWRSNSLVMPILPGLRFWKISLIMFYFLNRIVSHDKMICRGPMACFIALKSKRKNQHVVYDGRGAMKAEIEEFGVFSEPMASQVIEMEKQAVLNSDFRIAVSNKLVDYWKETFGYKKQDHTIIPCWSSKFEGEKALHPFLITDKPILVYSGSTSPWQSFPYLIEFCRKALSYSECKILFLTKEHNLVDTLQFDYPDRVLRLFVPEEEVTSYLAACDYGLLFREPSVTNKVASPVKFGEYLSCGLKIIISEEIGDISEQVRENGLGHVICNLEIPNTFVKSSKSDKQEVIDYWKDNYTLEPFLNSYLKILNF